MSSTDFIAHLSRKGTLRNGHAPAQNGLAMAESPGGGVGDDVDWLELTKLTPSAFADELAAFYGCTRVQRSNLLDGQFAGEKMSWRFLRERRLFPFEDGEGLLALAVAAPTDREAIR